MSTLLEQANQLKKQFESVDQPAETITEAWIGVYERKALDALLECFEGDSPNKERMIAFLKENWERSRLTFVGYTARPGNPPIFNCR